jgi:NAD(P)-dependent dehydrogenase (short-subunit alcohol dehydrogenase family)
LTARCWQTQCGRSGQQALFVKTNVAKEEDVRAVVQVAVERFGKLNIVMNNAGVRANYSSWEDVIRVNARGECYGRDCAVESMLQSGGGASVSASTSWAMWEIIVKA